MLAGSLTLARHTMADRVADHVANEAALRARMTPKS